MVYVSVQNGTGAGRIRKRPKPLPWECEVCETENAAHWNQCRGCGSPRG